MEELWTGTEYISGDQLTIADVYAACDVEQTSKEVDDRILIENPKINFI